MRICQKCGKEFPSKIKIDGKLRILSSRHYCLECSPFNQHNTKNLNIDDSDKKLKRRKTSTEATTRRRRKLKQMALDYKGNKCQICGYDKCVAALEFHHIDPSIKTFGIASQGFTHSWDYLKTELDKCALLCANCHREVENGITALNC